MQVDGGFGLQLDPFDPTCELFEHRLRLLPRDRLTHALVDPHAERELATPAGPHKLIDVVADRFRLQGVEKVRAIEAIEMALKRGGRLNVYVQSEGQVEEMLRFSSGMHCPESDLRYAEPTPSLFSFNSAMCACQITRTKPG